MKNLKDIKTYYLVGTACDNLLNYSIKVKYRNDKYSTLFFADATRTTFSDPYTFCWTRDLKQFIDNSCHDTFGCRDYLVSTYPSGDPSRVKIIIESDSLETFLSECNKLIVAKELSK